MLRVGADPQHCHLLLQTGTAPISSVMGRLLTGHAICFNPNCLLTPRKMRALHYLREYTFNKRASNETEHYAEP